MAKRKAMPENEVDRLFADNSVFFGSKKPKVAQPGNENNNDDIVNDTTEGIDNDISEGGLEGTTDTPPESTHLDGGALEDIVDAVYRHHAGRDQLQVKLSRQEVELVEKFLDQFKQREFEHQSLTVPKLYRYCTMYMIVKHPNLLGDALRNTLKKREGSEILNSNNIQF